MNTPKIIGVVCACPRCGVEISPGWGLGPCKKCAGDERVARGESRCLTCGDTGHIEGDTLATDGSSSECIHCDAAQKKRSRAALGERALSLIEDHERNDDPCPCCPKMLKGEPHLDVCAWGRIAAEAKA